jgi:hypothetical protein
MTNIEKKNEFIWQNFNDRWVQERKKKMSWGDLLTLSGASQEKHSHLGDRMDSPVQVSGNILVEMM